MKRKKNQVCRIRKFLQILLLDSSLFFLSVLIWAIWYDSITYLKSCLQRGLVNSETEFSALAIYKSVSNSQSGNNFPYTWAVWKTVKTHTRSGHMAQQLRYWLRHPHSTLESQWPCPGPCPGSWLQPLANADPGRLKSGFTPHFSGTWTEFLDPGFGCSRCGPHRSKWIGMLPLCL